MSLVQLDTPTRTRVLHTVSADGPISAVELAEKLDLTSAAVRRHLDSLLERGAICEHEPTAAGPRGRGRPARAYVISAAGHTALTSGYDSLATEALRFVLSEGGPRAVQRFAQTRADDLSGRYARRVADGADAQERVSALVAALNDDGFEASARPVGTVGTAHLAGIQICQGHCPVQHVAQEFPVLCDAETEAFSRLLGAHVQRIATLAGGAHVCTTFVPTGQTILHGATSATSASSRPEAPTASRGTVTVTEPSRAPDERPSR